MAKFLKSIFHPTDRRKSSHYEHEGDEEKNEIPVGSRRQLSISRSGRMRQANKKRHSLTLDLYGDTIQVDAVERPTSIEYHVHTPSHTAPAILQTDTTRLDVSGTEHPEEQTTELASTLEVALENNLRKLTLDKSPEEEIDNAFQMIDKS